MLKKEANFSPKYEVDNVKNRQLIFIKNTTGKIIHTEITWKS